MQDMTHGCGLIEHHFTRGVEIRFARLAELENTARERPSNRILPSKYVESAHKACWVV
jgi:hypothetical protein